MRCWKISYQIIDWVKLSEFYIMENLRNFFNLVNFYDYIAVHKKEGKPVQASISSGMLWYVILR